MCDTLCVISGGRTVFGKNSDRPPSEIQLVEAYPRRPAGGLLEAQYMTLDDPGARAVVGSRPEWLWGFEHGVNEYGVAIGNEKVYTTDDPYAAEDALIGMDLVRLGLERSENADDALKVMTDMLEHYGQGGVADASANEPYFSSFLVADADAAWILETSGRTWAARRVTDAAAISNRISLTTDWDEASTDVAPGTSFDRWRAPDAPTGHADVRLEASRACITQGPGPREMAAHLRHHGEGPWGAPGSDLKDVTPIPGGAMPDGSGVSICMHVRGYTNTTSSMICELPQDPAAPMRAWTALGNPCASVYVPIFPPHAVPSQLGDASTWHRFAALRDRAEADADALAAIRAVLAPVETELWEEADEVAGRPNGREAFTSGCWSRVASALDRLGV